MSLRFSNVAFALAVVLAAPTSSRAQQSSYPDRPVRIISPFQAGGGNDFVARVLAQKISEEWGRSIIVEDKTGGNGDIGTDYVARSKPDGYTLLVTTNATIAINPQIFKANVRFDPVADFTPISLLARQPFVLVANPKLPVNTFAELIDYARAHPNKLNFASSGAGGGAHLSGEMLKTLLNIQMTHVPYKGGGGALPAVVAGDVHFMFVAIQTAQPFVQAGSLRALAVTSIKRNGSMPAVPAVAEYPGLVGFEADLWYGLLAPAQTDPAIVRKIHSATVRAFKNQQMLDRFEALGTEVVANSPAEFAEDIKNDIGKWATVIKAAGLVSQ